MTCLDQQQVKELAEITEIADKKVEIEQEVAFGKQRPLPECL